VKLRVPALAVSDQRLVELEQLLVPLQRARTTVSVTFAPAEML
jgi:hypothetical protein